MTDKESLNTGAPPRTYADRVHDDNHVLNELKKILLDSTDAFGKSVNLGTTNEADLASHYDYSPERYRVYLDGTRQQIQYNGEPAQFTDNPDSFSLLPQTDGEVVKLETAERYRYVVQFVLEWSLAFQINQELGSGDVWVVGYGDADLENSTNDTPGPAADGWMVYQNSDHATQEATLAEYRDGNEVSSTTIEMNKLPQTWGRVRGATNWYNVGETNLVETYVDDTPDGIRQENPELGTIGPPASKGPVSGNHQIFAAVKAGAGAGSLELETGSFGARTLGDVSAVTRKKTFSFEESVDDTDVWQPVLAMREDPARPNVNIQFDELNILEFGGSDDIFGLILSFDSDNVRDTGGNLLNGANYTTPPEMSATTSVIETNSNVDQVADSTGALQSTMSDPGGYQLGFTSRYSSGTGGGSQRTTSSQLTQKRNLANSDVGVLMLKSPSTGSARGQITTEQNW